MKKVLAFGTFDLLHLGHKNFLEQAESLGNQLCVCIARDINVEKHKNKTPRWNENKRKKELEKVFPNAKVFLGYIDDVYQCLSDIQPDYIALGYDQNIFVDKLADELQKRDLNKTKIIRLKSYKPEIYKTSLVQKKD